MDPPCVTVVRQTSAKGRWRMEPRRTKRLHGVFVTEDTTDHLLIRLQLPFERNRRPLWVNANPKALEGSFQMGSEVGFISMLFCFADPMAGNKSLKDDC